MARMYAIYDVDFRNLAEVHELGTGEDLSRRMDLFSTDPTENIQFETLSVLESSPCEQFNKNIK